MTSSSTDYFDNWARRLQIDGLDPSDLHEKLGPVKGLTHGPTASPLGGRVSTDLKRLTPEELAERSRRSEEFLNRPVQQFPADEACQ